MTLKVLIIQNAPTAPVGAIGKELIRQGVRFEILSMPEKSDHEQKIDFSCYKGLVILGGPMGAYDDDTYPNLPGVVAVIKDFHQRRIPVLGICLGAQLLARALGRPFRSNNGWEVGFTPLSYTAAGKRDPLLRGLANEPNLYQLHRDSFYLPDGAELLMVSENCENQAFRVGPCSWGFQFHPEVEREIIDVWGRFFAEDQPGEAELIARLSSDINLHLPASEQFAREITQRWLGVIRNCGS